MARDHCVVCKGRELTELNLQKNMPISIGCSTRSIEDDVLSDLSYKICKGCGCAQLTNLIASEILYKESHNNTYTTPTWSQHHKDFSSFILTHSIQNSYLEIGGAPGILAKIIREKNPSCEYTILDICNSNPNIENVSFEHANCEEFSYSNTSTLLLSHVFEHLYNPLLFLEKIANANVPNVFISIPNMEHSLHHNSLSFLHVEHTYYIDDLLLRSMFSKYGFVCVQQAKFKNHSMFFHFVASSSCIPIEIPNEYTESLQTKFRKYIQYREELFQDIKIPGKFFLVPSGHFGQFMYTKLQKYKDSMLGFLDNDVSKIGKRLYGTHLYVYPMSEIKKYEEGVSIVIHAGPYFSEIKNQLLEYNPSLHFIEISIPSTNE
jgi:hypothetical protein